MNKINEHKDMYKSPRGKTPPWKEMYRKRCFERLRASRSNLVDKFRFSNEDQKEMGNIVEDVMEVEWNSISQNQRFPSLSFTNNNNVLDSSFNSINDFDEEATREMLLEIQSELKNEGEIILNEFLKFEEESLKQQVALMQNEVICPVCQIRKIEECQVLEGSGLHGLPSPFSTPPKVKSYRKQLRCKCGLTLNREDLSLTTVRSALQHTMDNHNQTCSDNLSFSSTADSNGTNIFITCSSCDWMSFLL